MNKYYGLYDLQLSGFKGGYASKNEKSLIISSTERIVELGQNDCEPPKIKDWSNIEELLELMEIYGYDIREISETEYNSIIEQDELLFLSHVVEL